MYVNMLPSFFWKLKPSRHLSLFPVITKHPLTYFQKLTHSLNFLLSECCRLKSPLLFTYWDFPIILKLHLPGLIIEISLYNSVSTQWVSCSLLMKSCKTQFMLWLPKFLKELNKEVCLLLPRKQFKQANHHMWNIFCS